MGEQEYIELQTLLAKLKVSYLKEIMNSELSKSGREEKLKLIRNIDNIRIKMPLKIGEGTIETIK